MPAPIKIGGNKGWAHNEGFEYGFFHTFDHFQVENEPGRKVHVFLPHEYDLVSTRYPVIYFHDGHTVFWGGGLGGGSWHVGQTLSRLRDELRKVIIVAIHPLDRNYELTHADYPGMGRTGGLDKYTAYVADKVKPWFDKHYRTLSSPENTAVVGASFGGLAAFYNVGVRPDVFGIGGCFSSSFDVGIANQPEAKLEDSQLIKICDAGLRRKKHHPKIWLSWGLRPTEHIECVRGRELVALLERKYNYKQGKDLFVLEDPYGEHNEPAWEGQFPTFMRTFFSASASGSASQQ